MKVEMLTTVAGVDVVLPAGYIVEVDDELGKALIELPEDEPRARAAEKDAKAGPTLRPLPTHVYENEVPKTPADAKRNHEARKAKPKAKPKA